MPVPRRVSLSIVLEFILGLRRPTGLRQLSGTEDEMSLDGGDFKLRAMSKQEETMHYAAIASRCYFQAQ
jgi:hypothetical protein